MPKLHRSLFLKEIKETFPELTEDINAEFGQLHLEMTVVKHFAQKLIDKGEKDALQECFSIVEKYYLKGNNSLQNAIDVSFVEPLEFTATPKTRRVKKNDRSWAWHLLPDSLKELYIAFHLRSPV